MSANALVVGPVDTSSALSGTMLLESLAGLSEALESGSWLDIALSGLSTALDTVAAVMDPLGQLLAAGLGWLMEHLQPLKGWLNDLTGDPGAVTGFAATWQNIAAQTSSAADGYARLVAADLEGMAGEGIEAYGRYADDLAKQLLGMSGSASAVASSLQVAATVVQVVHDIVRDALAEIVGAAISWAAEIVLTVGLGTPWVVSQVATRVSSLATRVGGKVTALISSTRSLRNLIDALKGALSNLAQGLRGARPGPMHTPAVPRLPDAPNAPDLPTVPDAADVPTVPRVELPSTHGVAFFGPDNLKYYSGSNATLGTPSSPFFHMPLEDSALVRSPNDALRYTGRAPSVEREVLSPAGGGDPEIYGLSFPLEGLDPRPPTAADAGGWPHYVEGGHTAVRIDDAPGRPGTGGYLANPTREFVVHGGPAVPSGSVLFRLEPDGSWRPTRRFQ